MRNRIFKVLSLLLAMSLLLLSLAACGQDPSNSATNSDAPDTNSTVSADGSTTNSDASNADGSTTQGSNTDSSVSTSAQSTPSQSGVTQKPNSTTSTTKKPTTTKKPDDNFKGTTYYVSSSTGDDWEEGEGTSQAKPVQSLSIASSLGKPGDRVLFKRGDVWRGEVLTTRSGVTYGAYGTGEAPKFYGSSQNYSVKGMWKQTSNSRIYYFDDAITKDVGGIVFNNGSNYGERKDSQSALKSDRHYYYDHSAGRLYLYSRKGDPADVWSSIELNERINLVSLKGNNVTIQDITFRYCDYGIVGGGNKNITIKNCNFAWIGGCLHSYSDTTRYGNAVELYGGVDGLTVDKCNFSQIFDTAVTVQYIGNTDTTVQNVTVSNNKIDKCQWSMEFWLEIKNSAGKYIGTIKNVKILNNELTNAGKGWSATQRWGGAGLGSSAHFMTMSATGYSVSDILIKNNVFKGGASALMGIYWMNYMPKFEGNTFIQTKGGTFGNMGVDGSLKFDDSVVAKIKKYDPTAKVEFMN